METKKQDKPKNEPVVTRGVVEAIMHPPVFDATYYFWKQDYLTGRVSEESFREFERNYRKR